MDNAQKTPQESNLPRLSVPANTALELAGFYRLEQLTEVTEDELLKLHGVGPKAIRLLKEALRAKGLDFRR